MANASRQWSDFGIDVNLQGLERSVWDQRTQTGDYQIAFPGAALRCACQGDSGRNSALHRIITSLAA